MTATAFQVFPRLCLKRFLPVRAYEALIHLKWQCRRPFGQHMRHMARCILDHRWPELYKWPLEKLLLQIERHGTTEMLQWLEIGALKQQVHSAIVLEQRARAESLTVVRGGAKALERSARTEVRALLQEIEKAYAQRYEEQEAVIEELKQQNTQLADLAAQDPLTGLVNRHALALQFETAVGGLMRELRETKLSSTYISAVIIDLDHFKRINDRYGHSAGDQVLVEMARRIRKYLGRRREDALAHIHARIGGEEFVVILPHADSENAFKKTTARFLFEVRNTPFLVTVNGEQIEISLTVSAGIATLKLTPETVGVPGEQYQELYEQADLALYAAKEPDAPNKGNHPGRDRAIRYDSLESKEGGVDRRMKS